MGRQDNVEIFEDTQRLYSSNERLISAIKNSSAAQECFTGMGRYWYGPEHRVYQKPAQTVISPKRTLEAAAPYVYAGRKVCVLNFASATNPGGGVVKGSSAQEEAICRCSTLYPLFQRQWRVIRIHAEAVDHLARHRLRCFLMGTLPHRGSGLCAEPIHQHLIFRLVDMPMQHVGQRCSICPTPKLAVIAEHRIVHQHDFSLIVMDLRIIPDPLKPGYVKIFVP